MSRMRVLSYNIHKGFSMGNRSLVLQEIRQSIRETQADIVCLQEVVGENRRHAARMDQWIDAQFEFLADQVWDYQTYGKNAIYSHGHHGNAILSKVPFVRYANHDISILPLSRRGVLHAVTEDGVHVLCAHLGLLSLERRYQMFCLHKLLGDIPADAPLIVAGDFNDWNQQVHRSLCYLGLREAVQEATGVLQKTFPARFPMLCMDRIYYRRLTLVEAGCVEGQHWKVLSDHRPLCAEFRVH